jgi:hypothetical protein
LFLKLKWFPFDRIQKLSSLNAVKRKTITPGSL